MKTCQSQKLLKVTNLSYRKQMNADELLQVPFHIPIDQDLKQWKGVCGVLDKETISYAFIVSR